MRHQSRRGFIAAGAAAIGAAACSLPIGAEAVEPEAHRLVDGVPIRVARMGSGRPVVLIHGASGNLNDMTFRLGPRLSKTFEVIAVDRPGHGLSGMPAGGGVTIHAQAALLRAAVAQLGADQPIVVGHSYGGSVALAWAVDAPDELSGLVLLAAPSHVWQGGLGFTTELLASPITGPPLAWAAPRVVGPGIAEGALSHVFAPQSPPAGYLEHLDLSLVLQPSSLRENARQLTSLKDQLRPMIPVYPQLAVPVELVHGEADRTVGLDIHSVPLVRELPRANLTRLPGIGHMLHQVATEEAAAAVHRVAQRTDT